MRAVGRRRQGLDELAHAPRTLRRHQDVDVGTDRVLEPRSLVRQRAELALRAPPVPDDHRRLVRRRAHPVVDAERSRPRHDQPLPEVASLAAAGRERQTVEDLRHVAGAQRDSEAGTVVERDDGELVASGADVDLVDRMHEERVGEPLTVEIVVL